MKFLTTLNHFSELLNLKKFSHHVQLSNRLHQVSRFIHKGVKTTQAPIHNPIQTVINAFRAKDVATGLITRTRAQVFLNEDFSIHQFDREVCSRARLFTPFAFFYQFEERVPWPVLARDTRSYEKGDACIHGGAVWVIIESREHAGSRRRSQRLTITRYAPQ